jgi:hypothetical protein
LPGKLSAIAAATAANVAVWPIAVEFKIALAFLNSERK